MSGTSTTSSISTPVDQSKAFLVFYYQSADRAVQQPEFNVRGYFSANNQLTFVRDAGTGTTQGTWYVVGDLGSNFDVQVRDITLTGATSNTGTISNVTMNKTFLVGSYQGGSSDDVIHGSVGAELTNTTTITVQRGGTSGNINSTVYAISFLSDETVQRGTLVMSGSQDGSTQSASLTAGDYSDAMATSAMRLTDDGRVVSGGAGSSDNADPKVRVTLDDANDELDFIRSLNGGNDATLDWEVVQWVIGSGGGDTSTIMSTEIDYDWFDGATSWNQVYWSEDETNGSVMVQVYYNDCATIIPDGALSGNSTGFTTSPINISGLSTSTYNEICIRATLADSGGTPYLEDWGVSVPEYSFLLLGVAPLLPGLLRRKRVGKSANSQ